MIFIFKPYFKLLNAGLKKDDPKNLIQKSLILLQGKGIHFTFPNPGSNISDPMIALQDVSFGYDPESTEVFGDQSNYKTTKKKTLRKKKRAKV